jgi:hypothetical protein
LGGFLLVFSNACKMAISKKIKKKAYEIAIAFNVPELRGSLRFNRRLDLLPAYRWSLAFSRHRADYSEFAFVRFHATRPSTRFCFRICRFRNDLQVNEINLDSCTMGDVDRENLCRPSLATDLIDYRPSKSYVNQAPQKDD